MSLGMLDYYPNPFSDNVWTPWVKQLMGHAPDCGVEQAAMINLKRRQPVAQSKSFTITDRDILSMRKAFEDKDMDRVRLLDKSFMLLPRGFTCDPSLLVAFNGSQFIIIGASCTMLVVLVIRKSREAGGEDKVRRSVELVKRVTGRLSEKLY
jgi:hypothetical protein